MRPENRATPEKLETLIGSRTHFGLIRPNDSLLFLKIAWILHGRSSTSNEFKYINLATSVSITLERSSCLHGHTGSSWPLTRRFVQSPSPRQISLRSQPSAFCFSPLICVSNRDVQGGFHYVRDIIFPNQSHHMTSRHLNPGEGFRQNQWCQTLVSGSAPDAFTVMLTHWRRSSQICGQTKWTFVFPTSQCESNTQEE